MKIPTKKIIIATLLTIEVLVVPFLANAGTPEEEQFCQSAYKMSCDDYKLKNSTDGQIDKEAKESQEKFCQSAYGKSCAEYECQTKYGKSCQAQSDQLRMASGQGFKLPLDFLTVQTPDGKKQGKSIFANKDYAQYGVLLGTFLRVIDILIYIIGSVALLTLVAAGIIMIANHGDEAWVTKGKGMMLYSILGVIFALLSFAVVNVITSILA